MVDPGGRPLPDVRLRRCGPHTVRWQGGDPVWIGNDVTTLHVSLEEQDRLRFDRPALEALCDEQAHPEEWRAALLGNSLPEHELQSGPGGQLSVDQTSTLDVVQPGLGLLAIGSSPTGDTLLIAAPCVELRGRVVDAMDRALPGADVTFTFETPQLLVSLERSGGPPTCRTDEQGRFVLRDVPTFSGAQIVVTHDDHAPHRLQVPTGDDDAMRIALEPWPTKTPRFEGIVVDGAGRAVPDAEVVLGERRERVSADGTFRFHVPEVVHEHDLLVWAPGRAPHMHGDTGRELLQRADRHLYRRIVLDGSVGEIRGRLRTREGNAIQGARIGLLEPHVLPGTLSSLEARIDERGIDVRSDERGRFRIGGLLGETSRLRVFVPESGAMFVTDAIAVGDEVQLVLPEHATGRRLQGHVTRHGKPLDQPCSLRVGFDWLRTEEGGALFEEAPPLELAPGAAFELERVPHRAAWIQVRVGPAVRRFDVETLNGPGPLELRLD